MESTTQEAFMNLTPRFVGRLLGVVSIALSALFLSACQNLERLMEGTVIEVTNQVAAEPTLDPCSIKLYPVDSAYPNPQENLDPLTGTTWMAITLEEGVLSAQDSYHYWWDTRAFSGDLSFNKGNGDCMVLLDTNQIRCEGIPLSGTGNLPTGGYEYDFSINLKNSNCNSGPKYQQRGLIFMDTLDHDVFVINGEAVP